MILLNPIGQNAPRARKVFQANTCPTKTHRRQGSKKAKRITAVPIIDDIIAAT